MILYPSNAHITLAHPSSIYNATKPSKTISVSYSSNNHVFLTRCTSTPLNRGGFLTSDQDFVTPGILTRERHRSSNFKSPDDQIPNFGFDSGFESDLSRSTPGIITRSRSRSESCHFDRASNDEFSVEFWIGICYRYVF